MMRKRKPLEFELQEHLSPETAQRLVEIATEQVRQSGPHLLAGNGAQGAST